MAAIHLPSGDHATPVYSRPDELARTRSPVPSRELPLLWSPMSGSSRTNANSFRQARS